MAMLVYRRVNLSIDNYIDIDIDYQWEFQDPKMEVLYYTILYHIRPYFVGILT